MFLSQHYAKRNWTNHEREAAQSRAFREREEYILPVRLDDTEIPGILPTIGYLKWRQENADTIADVILVKLGRDPRARALLSSKAREKLRDLMLEHGVPAKDKAFFGAGLASADLHSKRSAMMEELIALDRNIAQCAARKDELMKVGKNKRAMKLYQEVKNEAEEYKRKRDQVSEGLDELRKATQLLHSEMKALTDKSWEFVRSLLAKKEP
jgi:hypothetical protein